MRQPMSATQNGTSLSMKSPTRSPRSSPRSKSPRATSSDRTRKSSVESGAHPASEGWLNAFGFGPCGLS